MIDIRTFMLVLAIGNIGFAMLMAGYARTAAANPAMRVWAWAKLVLGCAHLLAWMRPDFPNIALPFITNSAMILGLATELAAYCIFFGFGHWKRVLIPCALLALLVQHSARLHGATPNQLIAIISLIIAVATGAMAYILLRPGDGHTLLRRVIGINGVLFCIVMSWRACEAVVDTDLMPMTPSFVQSVAYLASYILTIVNGFGFLLLCKEKDDQQMALLATIDSLTGLVNRRAFFERTESARLLAVRLRSPIALMMIDIDHFKRLNDRFGHATGDEALCLFAATAQRTLRDHDIMARLGGEEFALVLPATDIEGARQAAERLREAVSAAPMPTSGNAYTMTISVGVVVIDPNEHINAALARADHALYAAKSGGRDRVVVGEAQLRVVECVD